jgi:hypothetical protein
MVYILIKRLQSVQLTFDSQQCKIFHIVQADSVIMSLL